MHVLVTGATGKVGNAVVRAARTAGHSVRALVRNLNRAAAILPEDTELVLGDVTHPPSLAAAVSGCEVVFNAMGLPEQWRRDPQDFDRVNVAGSAALARAASRAGVRRFVHTSTIDVFSANQGETFDETKLATEPKGTAYERSKQRAEQAVLHAAREMEIVFANPAAVYGIGPASSVSLERQFFAPVLRGAFPVVPPGGFGIVFTEGLAIGHLQVAEHGRPGERYILSDGHVTMRRLAELVIEVAGRGRAPMAVLPVGLTRLFARSGEAAARVIRRPPLLAVGQLEFLLWNAVPDSHKAQAELGWRPTPLEEGIGRTLDWLARRP